MDLKTLFESVSETILASTQPGEHATLSMEGETSDFVRMNGGKIRQAGTVEQAEVKIRLIRDGCHVARSLPVAGGVPKPQLAGIIGDMREALSFVEPDPHLRVHAEPIVDVSIAGNAPDGVAAVHDVMATVDRTGPPLDLVGIWTSGRVARGFASSWGQQSWFERGTWTFDFSLVQDADKAVKRSISGVDWRADAAEEAIRTARAELQILGRPEVSLTPGDYRAWLSPAAVKELWGLLRGEFGARRRETRTSALMRAQEGKEAFSPLITAREAFADGAAPQFSADGWPRPGGVSLVESGALADVLVSSRSAAEYGLVCNGANGGESVEALELDPGSLNDEDVVERLGTGLLVSNLWYLNYSDRSACRVTGMTRFATLWVENGEIIGPVSVMRFDDSALRIFGSGLEALGASAPLQMSTDTYFRRATGSTRVPGALVRGLRLTL